MKTPRILEGAIAVLPIPGGIDVFTGIGWTNWSRFETKGGYPKLVQGRAVSAEDYGNVYKLVNK